MTYACLGWGSLIWDPRDLPITPPWRTDGPHLPVEFGRQSNDGRLTLVLAPEALPVPTLWVPLRVANMNEAVEALRQREGTIRKRIGTWPSADAPKAIGHFAEQNELTGIVWTALTPKFGTTHEAMPTAEEAVEYLNSLKGTSRIAAEEYIRRAPKQIATAYRTVFEEKLGWAYAEK